MSNKYDFDTSFEIVSLCNAFIAHNSLFMWLFAINTFEYHVISLIKTD